MTKFLILFFLSFNILFSDFYIPQNEAEKKLLENLRKKELKFGVSDTEFYNTKFSGNESMNDILMDLLSNYLQLNIKYQVGPFHILFSELKTDEIMGIAFINKGYNRDKFVDFSKCIFDENLYVISDKYKVYSLDDLDGKNIYYKKGSIYYKFINSILENNDFYANLIEVDDVSKYTDELIATPNPVLYSPRYGVKIGNMSQGAIGLRKEYSQLIPILNKALDDKYKKLIDEKRNSNNKKLSLYNFKNMLTPTELEYLNNLKEVNVSYKNQISTLISYYVPEDKRHHGIAPNLLNKFGELLNIKINDVTFSDEKPDIWIKSKTKERKVTNTFSKKIHDIDIYSISLRDNKPNTRVTGVVDISIEKLLINKYRNYNNVKTYSTYSELIEALNEKEIDYFLAPVNNLDQTKYNVTFFEKVPVNFAFEQNNQVLRDIINKVLTTLIDIDKIVQSSALERKDIETLNKIKTIQYKRSFLVVSGILGIFLLMAIIKIILDYKHKKELLKDSLSGLPNRNVFNRFCDTQSEDVSGYTFVIDIDNFKDLNDKFGHEFGDTIIKEISFFLQSQFSDSHIFRISGDEFYGVFIEDFETIIKKLSSYKDFCPFFKKYDISYSIGLHKKEKDTDIYKSFKYSDLALFKAKDKSGFSYKLADEDFIERKERELKILKLLEGDLNELYAVFQPKFNISTNKIIGGEALIRCKCKFLGDVYPNELIPIAEKFNFIHKIDYKVAEETFKFIKELINTNEIDDNFKISFNLSVKTFSRKDLIATIKELLEKYDVPGKYVEVEITETILVTDIQNILSKLSSLKDLSIQISLDDFTAGHSTARLLPLLPIDIIKFDKSLLDSLDDNEEKGKIIYQNLTSMIKDLKLKIVSEGIETENQLAFLKELDIDYGQGYLISRPLLKSDFLTFLKSKK